MGWNKKGKLRMYQVDRKRKFTERDTDDMEPWKTRTAQKFNKKKD